MADGSPSEVDEDVALLPSTKAQRFAFLRDAFSEILQKAGLDLLVHHLWPTSLEEFFCVSLKGHRNKSLLYFH